jgi:MFS family permease
MVKKYLAAYLGMPRGVYLLALARLVTCLGSFAYPMLTLILTQKLGMDKSTAGVYMSVYTALQAPCLVAGGRLADKISRRTMVVLCSLASSALFILCVFFASSGVIFWLLAAQAAISTLAYPSFDAMLAGLEPEERRADAYSLEYLAVNVGMAVSPIAAGLLFARHLPVLFVISAFVTAASAGIFSLIRGGDVRYSVGSPDGQTDGPRRPPSLFAVLRASPVLVGFVAMLFIYDFCYSQWGFMLPAQLGDIFGAGGARSYSLLCSMNAVTVITLTPLLTSFCRRFHPLAVVSAGGALYFAAFSGFGFIDAGPALLLFSVIFTAGEILVAIEAGAFVAGHAPPDCRGRAAAFCSFVRGAGMALGPMTMGLVLTAAGYRLSWLVTAAAALAGAAGMAALGRAEKRAGGKTAGTRRRG